MPVLREVVTRFKFETDEQAARKVDQRVNKMKRGISGIGKVLGLSLGIAGAKALFNFGQSGTRAKLVLDNLAGTKFEPLRKSMLKIKEDLNALKKGAGEIFTEREFNIAASGFIRTFDSSAEKLKLFDQIFRSAAKQSGITKQNVVELVQQFTSAVSSGDFSALLDFPGIDQAFVKRQEFINELSNLGPLFEESVINRRGLALFDILEKQRGQQNKALDKIPLELILEQAAEKVIAETTQQTAEKINRELVLGIAKTANEVKKKGFLGALQDSVRSLSAGQREDQAKRIDDLRRGITTKGSKRDVLEAVRLGRIKSGEKSSITKVDIHVNGAGDPVMVAKEVKKVLDETINNAKQNIIPTEDR